MRPRTALTRRSRYHGRVETLKNILYNFFFLYDEGSCLGALTRLIERHPEAFRDFDFPTKNEGSIYANAGYIYTLLTSFLVTHAHWGGSLRSPGRVKATQADPSYLYWLVQTTSP